MEKPSFDLTTFDGFINKVLYLSKGYLEKATVSDLGDFTDEGKIRNAGFNNYTVYWDFYNKDGYVDYQGQAYCACGVSESAVMGFGLEKAKKILCGDLYIYCPTGYDRFKAKGRVGSVPKKGAVAFFYSSSLGRYSHTGWVIGVDSNGQGYTTWEANTSSGNDVVVRNGGATCIKHYSSVGNTRFGYPDWESVGVTVDDYSCDADINTYSIGTGRMGLRCTANGGLNVRSYPKIGCVIDVIKYNEYVVPDKKTFIDGDPWYYIPAYKGWVSAKYFEGWVQEHTDGDKWWFLLPGYKYYVNQIAIIGDIPYFFGPDGYMFVGKIIFVTDDSGALKTVSKEDVG